MLRPFAPNAVTDVTGFGLFGHAHEMAERSGVRIVLDALPALGGALDVARAGVRTGGDPRNREFAPIETDGAAEEQLALGYDAQTAGGLLISLPAEKGLSLRSEFEARGLFVERVGSRRCGYRPRVRAASLLLVNAESASPALSRRRTFALSPERFRVLARWAVASLIVIVATGATVRLTGSGLGCHHWPGCQPNEFLPARGYHSDVEFSNRVVATLTVLTTLVLAIGSLLTRALARRVKVLAWLVFAGTLAQAPLGAITVYYDLNPYLVISHLLLSLFVLAVGVLVLLDATRTVRGAAPRASRDRASRRRGARSPQSARSSSRARSRPLRAHIPEASRFAASARSSRRSTCTCARQQPSGSSSSCSQSGRGASALAIRGSSAGAPASLVLLGVQMAIGETQYRNGLPWGLVLVHVTVAACVFAWTVGLVARLWRPVAPERT